MGKRKYESLKKSINFLKAERREHHFVIKSLQNACDVLRQSINELVRVNKLRWPDLADVVAGIEPQPTPFHKYVTIEKDVDPRIGTVAGETGAYQSGYMDGWHARENTQRGDWSDGIKVPKLTPEETAKLRTTAREGGWLGAKVSPSTRLPDGSGFFTASFPLPKDHWLYEKDADGFQPEMPENLKWPHTWRTGFERNLTEALKVAIRGATCGGKDEDFDPDALLMNFFSVLFRHSEETACRPTNSGTEPSPASGYTMEELAQFTPSRRREEQRPSEPPELTTRGYGE